MVNRYLKAFFLTLAILIVGLVAISFIDNSRLSSISDSVESSSLELQASQQLFLYEAVFPDETLCSVLNKRIELQKNQSISVLNEIESAQNNSLFGNTGLLKKKFLLQNVELYLLIKKAENDCGSKEIIPILYFFPDKVYCADCASQAKVLDSVAAKCSNVRVFAFPTDLDVPVIDLLSAKYSVKTHPSLVVNDKKLEGVISEPGLLKEFSCRQ